VSFWQQKKSRGPSWKLAAFVGLATGAAWLLSNPKYRGRAKGVAMTPFTAARGRRLNDPGLADKIRSEVLGSFPDARVNVNVENRVAVLRGQVRTLDHIGEMERAVRSVSGISDVRNYLHLQDEDPPNKADSLEIDMTSSQTDNTLQHKTLS
jgi:osmotically-inducible protein OsmY